MRDLETISAAVTAAETGHLVFATLHTTNAAQTIDRIIDVFPPHQQNQIRNQVANFLEGIISQTLLPKIDGVGRVASQEIITGTNAMRTLIREGKVHQMQGIIQSSSRQGMQTLEQSLRNLVKNGQVTMEEAMKKTSSPDDFKSLLDMI
jgi:twitching motility protein PilT